jgi:hypothetical protein
MSIATLKRKTQSLYNNISVSKPQFSLNGTHRTQGYVGQTSLSRHLQRTPMKGNVIRGNGGCCGTYRMMPIVTSGVQSAIDCLNNPNVVKSSVLNTAGMLQQKYVVDPHAMIVDQTCDCYWTKNNVVKPDYNQRANQSDYIHLLSKKVTAFVSASEPDNDAPINKGISSCVGDNKRLYRATNYNTNMRDVCGITKPEWKYVAMSQNNYISRRNEACSSVNLNPLPTSSRCGVPLP